jgi:hypothetical protein
LVIFASGCGNSVSPEQTKAISKLQSLGAQVNIKRGGYEVDLRNTGALDKHLEDLQKISNLKSLDLRGTRITDAGLEHLRPISTLEIVEMAQTKVTDAGVESLKKSLPNATLRH